MRSGGWPGPPGESSSGFEVKRRMRNAKQDDNVLRLVSAERRRFVSEIDSFNSYSQQLSRSARGPGGEGSHSEVDWMICLLKTLATSQGRERVTTTTESRCAALRAGMENKIIIVPPAGILKS